MFGLRAGVEVRMYRMISVCLAICALILGILVAQQTNFEVEFPVVDSYEITFGQALRVGEIMLPSGNYRVRHIMEGNTHFMVFALKNLTHPMPTRVKCSSVLLPRKAAQTEATYILNSNNEYVLHELIFKGDTAKHVF